MPKSWAWHEIFLLPLISLSQQPHHYSIQSSLYTTHLTPMQYFNIAFKSSILEISTVGNLIVCLQSVFKSAAWIKCILSIFRSFSILGLLSLVIFLCPKWSGILPRSTQPWYNSVTINVFSILYQPTMKRSTTTTLESFITNFCVSDIFFNQPGTHMSPFPLFKSFNQGRSTSI